MSIPFRTSSSRKTSLLLILLTVLTTSPTSNATTTTTTTTTTKTSPQQHHSTISKIVSILQHHQHCFNNNNNNLQRRRPFVTLSYAQTLDGMIGRFTTTKSSNLKISSEPSFVCTHALRSIHDAILIGGNTMQIDNPRLNVRLWDDGNGKQQQQPRPVVLDTHLKCLQNRNNNNNNNDNERMRANNVIFCCSKEAAEKYNNQNKHSENWTIVPCRTTETTNQLDLDDVLQQLYDVYGVRSIMVEGGSDILSSFLEHNLVNCMCITIAPNIIGGKMGLNAFRNLSLGEMLELDDVEFVTMGRDCVLIASVPRQKTPD